MFWPGVAGQFMSYLPITVFAVLIGSLFYALLFAPAIGALVTTKRQNGSQLKAVTEEQHFNETTGITRAYASVLNFAVKIPITIFVLSVAVLWGIITAYGRWGSGIEFYVSPEPLQTQVQIFARGNFSPDELRDIVLDAEDRVKEIGYYKGM